MSEQMHAEFDDVAAWTAEVALDLGPDHLVPAGCRGSGSPAMLRWFLDRLEIDQRTTMLDVGAGVGGPAAFAAQETSVRPVLTDPEPGACVAARRLFGLPALQAGSRLPFRGSSFDVVWSLGVLCTVPDQLELVHELVRVLRPGGRLGLLVYVARSELSEQPAGNRFPTEDGLRDLVGSSGLQIVDSDQLSSYAATTDLWQQRVQEVEDELARRFGDRPSWRTAEEQSAVMGRLIGAGEVEGVLLAARRPDRG